LISFITFFFADTGNSKIIQNCTTSLFDYNGVTWIKCERSGSF